MTKKFVRHEVKEVDVSKYLSNSFQFQQENKQQQKQQTGSLENHSSLQSMMELKAHNRETRESRSSIYLRDN